MARSVKRKGRAPYREGLWQKRPMWFCSGCQSTAGTEAGIIDHIRTAHNGPVVLDKSFRSGVDKVIVTEPEAPGPQVEPSMSMTKPDLLALARSVGSTVDPSATKREIVASIRERQSKEK
ncbi:MAG: hypothetical protein A3J75_06550 [Acidobacteria bacterium RBG_16_68_9]|nr:MAG: hypothetical protein A3J75_06550 [Acidobacteria bacterium RBG_16_68_9]